MAYLNKVFLIGNLTRDRIAGHAQGHGHLSVGIAVNRQFKDESGATRDETTFVDIEAWGSRGSSSPSIWPRAASPWSRGG